jgi:hypothetical protein
MIFADWFLHTGRDHRPHGWRALYPPMTGHGVTARLIGEARLEVALEGVTERGERLRPLPGARIPWRRVSRLREAAHEQARRDRVALVGA